MMAALSVLRRSESMPGIAMNLRLNLALGLLVLGLAGRWS